MNGNELLRLLAKAEEADSQASAQSKLENFAAAASNLAGNPQDPNFQTAFSNSFKEAKAAFVTLESILSPGDHDRLAELSMSREFSSELIDRIEKLIGENPATPAVVRDAIEKIKSERAHELSRFDELSSHLIHYGFEDHHHDPDKAELGFGIPRSIFDNELDGLIGELRFIQRLIRLVAEASGETAPDVELQSISTTDPLFWLLVSYGVAVGFGKVTAWGLDTWKKVEDIRLVRAQTAKLETFSEKEVEAIFGKKIEAQIKSEVEKQAKTLSKAIKPAERRNEIENGLRTLLPQFLARLERGLSVDVRYLPPPLDVKEEDDGFEAQTRERETKLSTIGNVAQSLSQLTKVDDPILEIEASNDD